MGCEDGMPHLTRPVMLDWATQQGFNSSYPLQLLSRADLQSDDKWFTESYQVYLNLIWPSGEAGAGDMAGGADHRPTAQSLQLLDTLERDLTKARADFERLMQTDLPEFNCSMIT
jgi:hypothetical protein